VLHLFLIHSPITRFVAEAAARHERLDPARVVLLAARGAQVDGLAGRCVPVSYADVPRSPHTLREVVSCRRSVRRVDRLVSRVTGDQAFHLYTPQTRERFIQIVRSHRRCRGFSLLEEGLYSYCTRAEIARTHPPMRIRLGDRLGYGRRVRAASFFEPGHARPYGVAPEVFPELSGRVVLPDAIPPAPAAAVQGIDHVLVLDGLTAQRRVRLESLLAALARLLTRLRGEGVARLHYKLHPAQLATAEAGAIEAALRAGRPALDALRLPDHLALEGVARARPETRWYVNLSSVGLYAAQFGCTVYSFAPWVAAVEPGFAELIARAPRAFADRVTLLGAE
jgi:hypothetical protein